MGNIAWPQMGQGSVVLPRINNHKLLSGMDFLESKEFS